MPKNTVACAYPSRVMLLKLIGGSQLPAHFLKDFLEAKITQPKMIIGRGILPIESKAIILGQAKVGKSFFAMNVALDLSRGRELFGAKFDNGEPIFPIYDPVRVLYIEKEIGEWSFRDRLRAMTSEVKNLSLLDFFVIPRDPDMRIDRSEYKKIVTAQIDKIRPKVVFLDPFSKFHGNDENSAQEMNSIARFLDQLMHDYGCSFIIVHHIGHEDPRFPRKGGDRGRGSTAVFGDVDTAITFDQVSHGAEPVVELGFDLRHGAPLPNMRLRRLESGLFVFQGETEKVKKTRREQIKEDADAIMEKRTMD